VHPELRREAKWELCGGTRPLPLNVTYFAGTNRPDATYTAMGMTNAGDVLMASGFVFEQRVGGYFAPGMGNSAETNTNYRIKKLAIAHVTAVRPVCSRRDLAPTASGRTIVDDQREASMTNKSPTQYKVANGVDWVSVEKARQLSAQQKQAYQTPPTVSKSYRAVFYLTMAAISAVFLWLLFRLKRHP
jgi:hypothetical protein